MTDDITTGDEPLSTNELLTALVEDAQGIHEEVKSMRSYERRNRLLIAFDVALTIVTAISISVALSANHRSSVTAARAEANTIGLHRTCVNGNVGRLAVTHTLDLVLEQLYAANPTPAAHAELVKLEGIIATSLPQRPCP